MKKQSNPAYPVLIVDDEEQALLSASVALNYSGINNVVTCQDSRKVEQLLSKKSSSSLPRLCWAT